MDELQNVPEVHIDVVVSFKSRNVHRYTVSASKLNAMQQLSAVGGKIQQDIIEDKTYSDVFEQIPSEDVPAVFKPERIKKAKKN